MNNGSDMVLGNVSDGTSGNMSDMNRLLSSRFLLNRKMELMKSLVLSLVQEYHLDHRIFHHNLNQDRGLLP